MRTSTDGRRSIAEAPSLRIREPRNRLMKRWFVLLMLTWAVAAPLLGQEPPSARRFEIRGTVFDSIAGRPLAGARVEIAARGAAGTPRVVFSDSVGRFAAASLPAGQFLVGVYHDQLTAWGLDGPVVAVELGADSTVTVALGIPSAAAVRALRCGGGSVADDGGLLVGAVRDAATRLAVPGAVLRLSWRAFALDSGDYRTVVERRQAELSADGSYLACEIPRDATLDLEVTAPGHRSLAGPVVVIPPGGVARLEVDLVDTARTSGASSIRGHVSRPNGKAVTTGRARIAALGREVPIRDGEFMLTDLPPGSWVVDARTIGSEPRATLVSVRDSVVSVVAIPIGESLQRLEAVTVVGKRDANTRLLEEILRRKRIGMGTVFLPGSPALKSATFTSDVMKEARGFLYEGSARISARVSMSTYGASRCRNIAVFIDDILQPLGFDGIDAIAPPSQVLAIEAYADILQAPIQYRTMKTVLTTYAAARPEHYCAVVLIWTKSRGRW